MRWLAVVVAVTGCGRIAFDPRSDAGGDGRTGDGALVCPPNYTPDSGSCYRNGGSMQTWLAAEAACEADGVGAHLVVIGDAAEAAVATKYTTTPGDFAWIGVNDLMAQGTYKTVTNVAASYLKWAASEPDGLGQDCVLLVNNLELNDGDCANLDDFICEYDGVPAVSLGWGICRAGYSLMDGGCYRFVDGNDDWYMSEAACEADGPGSHLVIVDNMIEAMAVDIIVPSNILDHFVGATDLVNEGTFVDVLGRAITFTTFQAAEPDGGTNQNCMLMTDAVELKDADCNAGDDYVCEFDGLTPIPASWGQ